MKLFVGSLLRFHANVRRSVIYKLFGGRHNDVVHANADEKLFTFINMMKPRDFLMFVNLNNVILFKYETVQFFFTL